MGRRSAEPAYFFKTLHKKPPTAYTGDITSLWLPVISISIEAGLAFPDRYWNHFKVRYCGVKHMNYRLKIFALAAVCLGAGVLIAFCLPPLAIAVVLAAAIIVIGVLCLGC